MKKRVVVGKRKRKSRTLDAALLVTKAIVNEDPAVVVDGMDLGAGLLGRGDEAVRSSVADIYASDIVIFASPPYKGAYTGLLKLVLDQIPHDSLRGVTAVPLMLLTWLEIARRPILAMAGLRGAA